MVSTTTLAEPPASVPSTARIPVVFSMGKVGSTAIYEALIRAGRHCYHCHSLDRSFLFQRLQRDVAEGRLPNPDICRSMEIVRDVEAGRRPYIFITGVRDPLARNLSAFFQNIVRFVPEAERPDAVSPVAVFDRFLQAYNHDLPLTWFDTVFAPASGIDVYARPFDPASGIQDSDRHLLLRVDVDDRRKADALQAAVGLALTLHRDNEGHRKGYAELYSRVKRLACFDAGFLDRLYDSRYARHFWTDAERERMYNAWRRG